MPVCVCVLGIHHSKTDIEVCWEWLPAPQRTKINGLVLLVSTKPQSSLLTAPKPLFTTHISRCVHIKVHTKAMTHESNIHTLSTQPTACICELLFKLFQYTSQPQNEWLHLQMQAFLNWWFSPTSQELSSYPLQKCPKLGDVLKVLLLQFCSSSNMLCLMIVLWRLRQIWAPWGGPDLTGNRRLCQCFLCSAFVERTVKV